MIVKIWPIKAKHGGMLRNLQSSLDYIKDPDKMMKTPEGNDLQLEYDNLSFEEQQEISWEEFKKNNEDNFNRVLSYAANEDKTDGYISGYLCDPEHAAEEFIQTKQINLARVGKTLKDDTGNHAYHLVQSFPEELDISDEEVHRCGQELVERLGKYQAVICSHVHPVVNEDQEVHGKCKHNHIIINSHIHHELIDLENPAKMKYNDCKETYAMLQLINDQIAIEHGLPIIVSPDMNKTYSWYETTERNAGKSWKERVRIDIENAMRVSNNIDEYKTIMERAGYTMRDGNSQQYGQYISYITPNGKKVRDYTLGQAYTYEQLRSYWSIKHNLADEIEKNAQFGANNPLQTILENTDGQVFINIKRSVSSSRKAKLAEQGKASPEFYSYHFPVPTQYDNHLNAEKTYFETHETYEILNDKNQVIATLTGAEILNYYRNLEETYNKNKEEREDGYYINPNFRSRHNNKPYQIPRYDENGRRRNTVELICILAIVILNKEDEYLGISDEDLIPEQKNDPIYARRAWKLENMVNTLRVAREEQIQSPGDIDDRLNTTGKTVSKAKAEVRRLTSALQNMDFLNNSITAYQSVKEVCENINKMPDGPEKDAMQKRHADKIEQYKQAKAAMYRHKISSDEQIAEFEERYAQMAEKLQTAEESLADAKEEYRRLSKLRYNVQLAQSKQYVYGPGYVEQQRQAREQNETEQEHI